MNEEDWLTTNLDPAEEWKDHQEYMRLVREYFFEIAAVKELCREGEAERAKALWDCGSIPELARIVLWRAPSRGFGSIFETWEREMLRKGDECMFEPVSKVLKQWVEEQR